MARDIKKVDAKGRFFIPAKQKEELGEEVVVTVGLDQGYLCVYSKERFARIKAQFATFNTMDPNARLLKRVVIGESMEVKVDSQGRISVSSELWDRIFTKPGDEICVISDDDKLDICSKTFYEAEDHNIGAIVGLDSKYYVEGL